LRARAPHHGPSTMVSKLLFAWFLLAGLGAAKYSCEVQNRTVVQVDTVLLQIASARGKAVDSQHVAQELPFFGLLMKSDRGNRGTVPMPVESKCFPRRCKIRTPIGWCKEYAEKVCKLVEKPLAVFAQGPEGRQMLKWTGVRTVVFESHGVKAYTRSFVIRTQSAGSVIVLAEFGDDSVPTGSGLLSNHAYANTAYSSEPPAVFTAGDPGYVFRGSFEIQPGATITLTMKDDETFDLVSFYVDKFEIDWPLNQILGE